MHLRTQQPWEYEFYQLVRLLELDSFRQLRMTQHTRHEQADTTKAVAAMRLFPVGEGVSPRQEPVRFKINPSMTFAPAVVKTVEVAKRGTPASSKIEKNTGLGSDEDQWQMAVNVMGLIGATGVMPFRYSELVIQRLRAKDYAMKAFFDVFNHRTLTLLYRAWKKYRPEYSFETDSVASAEDLDVRKNNFVQMMAGLCGLSQECAVFNRPEGVWLNYAGVSAHKRCNEYTLKNVIRHHFGINVKIHQFKGRWQRLDADVVTRLAGRMQLGMNNQLGKNALLGEKCWVAQNLFEVEVIDLTETQLAELSPGSQKLKALYAFVKQRAGIEMDFDLSLKIKERELPVARLGVARDSMRTREDGRQSLLGWNTRLHSVQPTDRKIRISISKYGMQYNL